MSAIKPTQRIWDVVKDIKTQYRLPSIQRSFVWEEDRICKLMDSLMNDYPIGSFLFWKPPQDLSMRTREFLDHYESEATRPVSQQEPAHPSCYLVLDGQQRLQSFYLGFFGTYDKKHLYFKGDSDPLDESDGLRYHFSFLTPDEVSRDTHWLLLRNILELSLPDIPKFVKTRFASDDEPTRDTITRNLAKFVQVFNIEEKLPIQEVKEDLPYNDVLEVFVRVNDGGLKLAKSDLIFSTVVLNIPDLEDKFIQLEDELNGGGEFDFGIDFLIKTSFLTLGAGAKYDVRKLHNQEYVRTLGAEFGNLGRSLLSTMEYLRTDAKILSKRFLKSDLALIPIVDFVYHQPHQQIPEGQAWKLTQYLYMSFLMKFYSHGADGKLDVIHRYLTQPGTPTSFPLDRITTYVHQKTGKAYAFTDDMLKHLDLVLNMVRGGVSEIPRKRAWSLERDHIFPARLLRDSGIPHSLANRVGNLRLVNKTRNILKSDSLPNQDIEFFGSDVPELQQLFSEARKSLTTATFKSFVSKREELILSQVRRFLRVDS